MIPYLLPAAISLALMLLLWHGDPKRRRVARLAAAGHGTGKRRALAALALVPGIALAATGDSAAFLVWFGACAIGGWLIAQLRPRGAAD